jgi:hypothetical protein
VTFSQRVRFNVWFTLGGVLVRVSQGVGWLHRRVMGLHFRAPRRAGIALGVRDIDLHHLGGKPYAE